MPILPAEIVQYPDELFAALPGGGEAWWVLHTRPRQEKSLARELLAGRVPFYLPQVSRRACTRGRVFTSHVPLFPGYVFLLGNDRQRIAALATRRVVHSLPVVDQESLWQELGQIHRLIEAGAPVTPEERLGPGQAVEICSGPLTGLRGIILRIAAGRRFVVRVDFIQRGASVELDDFTVVRPCD
jgi:transcription antitermination factor NusG